MSTSNDDRMPVKFTQSSKPTIRESIMEVLHSDIVWFSVAFGCVLGVILFYFQGLQPLLLRYHIIETKEDLITLQETYVSQMNTVRGLDSRFNEGFRYSPIVLCSEQERYTNFTEDANEVDRIQVALLNAPKPNNLTSNVSLEEVRSEYNQVYDLYSQQMETVRGIADGFVGIPSYLNYINAWIDSCELLEESDGLNSDVAQACRNIEQSYAAFQAASQPFFWEDVRQRHEVGLAVCSGLGEIPDSGFLRGFNTFKLEWLSNYSSIRQYIPDFFTQLEPLNDMTYDFGVQFERTDQELISILDSRRSFGGMWYLVDFGRREY